MNELMNIGAQTPQLTTTTNFSQLDGIIDFYSRQLDAKQATKNLYTKAVRQFLKFELLQRKGDLLSMTIDDILSYKQCLVSDGRKPLTIAAYINAIRRFFEFTDARGIFPNIAKGVKAPKRVQKFHKQPLTIEQTQTLIKGQANADAIRDYAIINLMVRTGLRCIEVVRANIDDITYLAGKRILKVQGKGRDDKDNFVILTDAAYEPIAQYIASRGAVSPKAPLFASESHNNKGGRMTTRAISFIAKQALISIGLNDSAYTAHSLRHTAAVNILRAGGSLEQAQYTLRHANSNTTQIYTATIKDEQRLKFGGEYLIDKLY